MSTPAGPSLVAQTKQPAAPAKPLTAIQTIETELAGFFKQREQAIANVHAVDGAIQAAQVLLGKLRAAEAEAKKLAEEAAAKVKAAAEIVVEKVETEAESIAQDVESL
jgi:hypothetical protein